MSISDEMLATRAQTGDIESEEALMRKYKSLVRMKARAFYIAGADEEDVVQEGMIGLLKAIRQYDADKNAAFGTFADLCITRQIITAIRDAGRKKHQPLNTSLSLSEPVGTDAENVTLEDTLRDDETIDPESMYILKDIVAYISHNEGSLLSDFEMKVLAELMRGSDYETIAEKLGRTPKSIDNAVRRAKKKIAQYISA